MERNLPSINDWSEYLLWAEKNLKDLEDMLLHKNYDMEQIAACANNINHSLGQTLAWVRHAKQTEQ